MKSKRATKSSEPSRSSERPPYGKAAAALVLLSALAGWYVQAQGWTLYYGDAEAHLTIARRITDSRTPGYEQIGTAWLPLPHVLALPLARYDGWWRTGLAGAAPAALGFVLAGLFLLAAVNRALGPKPAVAAAAILALNPNLLYLQSAPMTEPLVMAAWAALLYALVCFGQQPSWLAAAGAGFAALLGTLTRYDGWWLLPFAGLAILAAGGERRWRFAVLFSLIAALGPFYWLAHNYYIYSDALEFYRGEYSARAIYARGLASGYPRAPGDGNWLQALQYYTAAGRLCVGTPLYWAIPAGLLALLVKRAWSLVALGLAIPLFYVVSLHGAGTPVYVPHLWPNSWYNTRYGIHLLSLGALAAAGLVSLAPQRVRGWAATLVAAAAVSPWLAYPRAEGWITWKESQVNSRQRRGWTHEAAAYLAAHYRPRDGVFSLLGDQAGIYREAGIPLREVLHDGNFAAFRGPAARPDLMLFERWAVCQAGDEVCRAMETTLKTGPPFERVKTIARKGAPALEIWRRRR
jgi:hypothetical protein